jgi:NADH:ubiquinone oxidoreductase subunit
MGGVPRQCRSIKNNLRMVFVDASYNQQFAQKKKKYLWQKDHLENQTGTINSYKPNFISKLNKDKKKYDTWKN